MWKHLGLSILVFTGLCLLIPANCDVIIRKNVTGSYINISFSQERFKEFHSCVCDVRNTGCTARYNDDNVCVNVFTNVNGENDNKINYVCVNSLPPGIRCNTPNANVNSSGFPVIQGLNCPSSKYVVLHWAYSNERIIFDNQTICKEYCSSGCTCSDMTISKTAATLTATTTTAATTTPDKTTALTKITQTAAPPATLAPATTRPPAMTTPLIIQPITVSTKLSTTSSTSTSLATSSSAAPNPSNDLSDDKMSPGLIIGVVIAVIIVTVIITVVGVVFWRWKQKQKKSTARRGNNDLTGIGQGSSITSVSRHRPIDTHNFPYDVAFSSPDYSTVNSCNASTPVTFSHEFAKPVYKNSANEATTSSAVNENSQLSTQNDLNHANEAIIPENGIMGSLARNISSVSFGPHDDKSKYIYSRLHEENRQKRRPYDTLLGPVNNAANNTSMSGSAQNPEPAYQPSCQFVSQPIYEKVSNENTYYNSLNIDDPATLENQNYYNQILGLNEDQPETSVNTSISGSAHTTQEANPSARYLFAQPVSQEASSENACNSLDVNDRDKSENHKYYDLELIGD